MLRGAGGKLFKEAEVMRILVILIWGILGGFCFGEKLEVRAYQVTMDWFERLSAYRSTRVLGERIEEDVLGCCFLKKGDQMWEMSQWGRNSGVIFSEEERMILNAESMQLVVRGSGFAHAYLERILEGERRWQLRVKVRLLKVPGVAVGNRSFFEKDLPKEVRELGAMEGVSLAGKEFVLQSPGGELRLEAEVMDHGTRGDWDGRVVLQSKMRGGKVRLTSILAGAFGVPVLMDLGSRDGKDSLVGVVSVDRVFVDGSDFDDWILKEEGAFLAGERLRKMKSWILKAELGDGRVRLEMALPRGITNSMRGVPVVRDEFDDPFSRGDDPFAIDWDNRVSGAITTRDGPDLAGVSREMRGLLVKNGVAFLEGDRVGFFERGNVGHLVVETSEVNAVLIEGMFLFASSPPAHVYALGMTLVESDGELTKVDLREGTYDVLKKITGNGVPGLRGDVALGKRLQMLGEVFSVDGRNYGQDVEMRLGKGGGFKVNAMAKLGVPMVVHSQKVGEKWQSWVMICSRARADDLLGEE